MTQDFREGLGVRAWNALCGFTSKEQVKQALKEGRLIQVRGVGPTTVREIQAWLGLPPDTNRRGVTGILSYKDIPLRDWFAGQALASMRLVPHSEKTLAERAYRCADAMLAARLQRGAA